MQIINKIDFDNLRGDIFGGVTAAIIALPVALAFGVASGAGASAGMWGAILIGFFTALFGGTPGLISEPTGSMTVITTAVIAKLVEKDPETGLAMAFTVIMMAGIFQILFGLLKLGKYITMLSYNVISGFMTGIGVTLIILQIAPLSGQEIPNGGVLGVIRNLPDLIVNFNPLELGLGLLTLVILFIYPNRWKTVVPPQLVTLIIGTLVALLFLGNADIRTIATVGKITAGLPNLQIPVFSLDNLQLMFTSAVVLAIVSSIDSLLSCVICDSLTRSEHQSNKELIGQGVANLITGFCGGIAGAGATTASVVNIQAGGRTALAGICRALVLLMILLLAASTTSAIPLAVLSGIVLKVGIDIIDWSFLKRVHQISIKATGIVYTVVLLTVFVDLMVAVAVGVFITNLLTIDRLMAVQSDAVKTITNDDDQIFLSDEEKFILDSADGSILLFHLSGPMIFSVAKNISRQHDACDNYDVLIVDLSEVSVLGVTASLAIEKAISEAIDCNKGVIIVGAIEQVKSRLQKMKIASIPENCWIDDRFQALKEGLAIAERKKVDRNLTTTVS